MSDPNPVMPAAGGSYTRMPDGSLVERDPHEGEEDHELLAETTDTAEPQPTPKRAAKSPLKEG